MMPGAFSFFTRAEKVKTRGCRATKRRSCAKRDRRTVSGSSTMSRQGSPAKAIPGWAIPAAAAFAQTRQRAD